MNLPVVVLERFIHDFCNDCHAAGKKVNPGLIAKAVREDLISWRKKLENKNFIEGAQRKAEIDAQRQFAVEGMRNPEEAALQQRLLDADLADPENAEKFMAELGQRRRAKPA